MPSRHDEVNDRQRQARPQNRHEATEDFTLGHAMGLRDRKWPDDAEGVDPYFHSESFISGYHHGAQGNPHPGAGAT